MAGEELSAGPATRNYEPLYFCGDASLSNQAAVWKDISALFSPLSFQNTLSEPWGRAQAHHNVSLPCLSTAAVRSTTVPQKYLKLHSCYTVGELYDFFFSFFKAQICTKKRAEGSQGLNAIQRLCGTAEKKARKTCARANRCACRETESPSSPRCHSSLPDRPFKSHSGG